MVEGWNILSLQLSWNNEQITNLEHESCNAPIRDFVARQDFAILFQSLGTYVELVSLDPAAETHAFTKKQTISMTYSARKKMVSSQAGNSI